MKATEERSLIFRDVQRKPIIWLRDPDHDIVCPLCEFEKGPRSEIEGIAWAYLCKSHWRTELISTRVYHCPHHQREVSPLMIPGDPKLEELFRQIQERRA